MDNNSIHYRVDKHSAMIYLLGELSFNTLPDFDKQLPSLIQSMPDNFCVDFAETKLLSSAALVFMLAVKRQACKLNKSVSFIHFPPQVNRIIKLAALENILY